MIHIAPITTTDKDVLIEIHTETPLGLTVRRRSLCRTNAVKVHIIGTRMCTDALECLDKRIRYS